MGEYAYFRGERIKIGTCDDLYYLRADQVSKVYGGDVSGDWRNYCFRFPFPDEDDREPGSYDDAFRRVAVPGLQPPGELAGEHHSILFRNQASGYILSISCPEGCGASHDDCSRTTNVNGVQVHRNGFQGAVSISQQKPVDGQLWPILECVCRMKWSVGHDDSSALFAALEAAGMAERHCEEISYANTGEELPATWHCFWNEIADRIRHGYDREYVAPLGLWSRHR